MKCNKARHYLSPYLDSELDPTTTYEISRHLAECARCARLFEQEERLDQAIFKQLRTPTGDEEVVLEHALNNILTVPSSARRTWFSIALGLVALLLVAVWIHASMAKPAVPELLTMLEKDHARYLRGELEPDLRDSDPQAIRAYLRKEVSYDIGVLPSTGDWIVEGARVCRFDGIRIGMVTLRHAGTLVSLICMPADSLELTVLTEKDISSSSCFELRGGMGVIRRATSGLRVVFGDIGPEVLEELARPHR